MLSASEFFDLGYKEFNNSFHHITLEDHKNCCRKAIDYFVKARELDSNLAGKSYFYCGILFEAINDYEKAIENYSQSIQNFKDSKVYFNRGTLYQKLGFYQEAIDDFNEAIKLDSKDAIIYNSCAFVYEILQKLQLAKENYSKAILNFKEPAFYCNRGSVYHEDKNYGQAEKDFTIAIGLYQSIVNRYLKVIHKQHFLIFDFFKKKNKNEEQLLFTQEKDLMEVEDDSYLKIESIVNQIADHDQVLGQVNQQLALVYFKRSIVYFRLNRISAAKKDYEKAVELDPELENAYIKVPYQSQALSSRVEIDNQLGKRVFSAHQELRENDDSCKKFRL